MRATKGHSERSAEGAKSRNLHLLVFALCVQLWGLPLFCQQSAADRVRADISWLASDRLAGRRMGDPEADSAAAYIAARFEQLGLRALGDDISRDCAGAHCRSFLQWLRDGANAGANVVAFIPGTDAALRDEFVVIGAHYDHLGRSPVGSLDPEAKNAIRNGADDNASGTAAVLELARSLAAAPVKRSVVLVAFTGEERGLIGSTWFVTHAPMPMTGVTAMLNFDMVGRLGNGKLTLMGVGSARELAQIVQAANLDRELPLNLVAEGNTDSDQSPFQERGVPVLHFFTGYHADYHRATDDAARIDYSGEMRVIALADAIVRAIGNAPARLTH